VSFVVSTTDGACAVDCPFPMVVCPAPGVNKTICNGHGVCLLTSGVCDCFGGYTGTSCDTCATGYKEYTSTSGCVMIPAPSCLDGVMNGEEDGIDCGASCEDPCEVKWSKPAIGIAPYDPLKSLIPIIASIAGVAFFAISVVGYVAIAEGGQPCVEQWLFVPGVCSLGAVLNETLE
jgi:EGF-like domain